MYRNIFFFGTIFKALPSRRQRFCDFRASKICGAHKKFWKALPQTGAAGHVTMCTNRETVREQVDDSPLQKADNSLEASLARPPEFGARFKICKLSIRFFVVSRARLRKKNKCQTDQLFSLPVST
jgi:hypothetical protein